MDTYEATKIVLSRIQSLDPENASKITGYILIQDQGEKEMIRLAFSPESLLVSYVSQAKVCLGLSSSKCSTPSTPSSVSPFTATTANSNPLSSLNRCNPFSQTSPRVVIPNTRFHLNNPSSPSSPWSARSPRSASYAAVVNGSTNTPSGLSSSSLSSPFFGNNNANDLSDEFSNIQVQDQLPFLEEPLDPMVSPSRRSDSVTYPYETCEDNSVANHQQQLHRRSFSVNDVFLGGGEDGGVGGSCGFGWTPCLYFAKGFCKNGNTCKFLHSGGGFGAGDPLPDGGPLVGSPGKLDGFDELLKLKAFQQQRLAQQLMASGAPPLLAYNKCATFPSDNQRSAAAAAAFAMGDEFLKLGRCRPDRSDLYTLGFGGSVNSASRQIYLTFPADSTFKEEDVSKYFSIYGPVQDVRIPYQQKRMFGFVTFLYAETVKLILAKGNPHFVCDSRVLVKPYKEKGKIPDKKERGDFSGCLSPSGHESRDLFDLPFGSRMFCNAQEIMLRRKFEQEAELKQAIELHGRRLMNMQLMDLKNHHPNQFQTSMLSGHSNNHPNLNPLSVVNGINSDVHEDTNSPTAVSNELQVPGSPGGNKDDNSNAEESDFLESLENVLPDNLFASPTKSDADMNSAFASDDTPITSANYISMLPTAAHKSCYFQMSRFSSGQEAAEI